MTMIFGMASRLALRALLRVAVCLTIICCPIGAASAQNAAQTETTPREEFWFATPYFMPVGDATSVPSGIVTALTHSRDGLLWIGTQNGLLRYDGYRFLHYQNERLNPNSLAGNFVSALANDSQDRIWIGTVNNGVSVFAPNSNQFTHYGTQEDGPFKLPSDAVYAILQEGTSQWLGTSAGLLLIKADATAASAVVLPPLDAKDALTQRVRSLLLARDGTLWVGTWNGLLRRNAAQEFERFQLQGSSAEPFAGQIINTLSQDENGLIWVGTREYGLARINATQDQIVRLSTKQAPTANADQPARLLATDRIQAIAQRDASHMWVATTVGLYAVDVRSMEIQQHWTSDRAIRGSLAFDALGALLKDNAGGMWIGTWGAGLQRANEDTGAFRSVRLAQKSGKGLSMSDVHAVLERSDGSLWLGLGGTGIDVLEPRSGRRTHFAPDASASNALGDGVVVALQEAKDGVWVGTQRGGLFWFSDQDQRFTRIGPAATVSNLLLASDGALWLGGSNGVERIAPGSSERTSIRDSENEPLRGQIFPMMQDRQGNIWIGTGEGLRVLPAGATSLSKIKRNPAVPDSLAHDAIYGMVENAQGQLWFATEQSIEQLRSWDGERARFENWSARLAFTSGDLGSNLSFDQRGRIWTDKVVIDPNANSLYVMTRADGYDVGTAWTGAHTKLRSGKILQGGTEGLAIIDPSLFDGWQHQPSLVATELRIDGLHAPLPSPRDAIVLKSAQRSFSVEFAALDFSAPELNKYAYRLENFDADWIATGAEQRRASYSNLWPGDYLLHIRGSNRTGVLGEKPLTIPIRVQAKLWQQSWFAMLSSLLLLALLTLAWRTRTHRLHARSAALDREVQHRTAELKASNSQLLSANQALEQARLRLEQTQAQLVYQEKMASLGALVAGVAHEVNTPLGIAVTASSYLDTRAKQLQQQIELGQLRKSELETFAEDLQTSARLLTDHIRRAAGLVDQFKQVSVDRTHDVPREVQLEAYLHELIGSLNPELRKSKVRLRYLPARDGQLHTHLGALGQIFTNLVQNALLHAFAPQTAGCITVTTDYLEATSSAQEHEVILSVQDDGIGMDALTQAKIFEPFFTTKRNHGGTGLGLHIVYNLATSTLGGQVSVQSSIGAGSVFTVRFPANAPGLKNAISE
jgi:signal transduction histidine kinase/ligand-binding sensor domain-containing protein